jgi:hypothetical protein
MTYTILAALAARAIRKLTGYVVTGLFEHAQSVVCGRDNQRGFVSARQVETL